MCYKFHIETDVDTSVHVYGWPNPSLGMKIVSKSSQNLHRVSAKYDVQVTGAPFTLHGTGPKFVICNLGPIVHFFHLST